MNWLYNKISCKQFLNFLRNVVDPLKTHCAADYILWSLNTPLCKACTNCFSKRHCMGLHLRKGRSLCLRFQLFSQTPL
uniref:Uncharacterized protein n=1 Tax=Anguilla anguilla TaxID=7936 RepID=A0A0E9VZH1_ANGAN